jgi:hypothetical protein
MGIPAARKILFHLLTQEKIQQIREAGRQLMEKVGPNDQIAKGGYHDSIIFQREPVHTIPCSE